MLLVGRFVPTKVIRVGNKVNNPWFDNDRRNAFGLKHEAHFRWTLDRSRDNLEGFVRSQVRANETYLKAKRQSSVRNKVVHMNIQSAHKWLCSA